MRIALLMTIQSPWARQVALRLCRQGHDVHVIDFRKGLSETSYLAGCEDMQAEDIRLLVRSAASIRYLATRFKSGLRYFTCRRQVAALCRECEAEVLLSLYGGGWGSLAWLSGFRPFAIYAVGSDVLLVRGPRRWIARRFLTRAARVFANGEYLASRTRSLAPRADVVPLLIGIDAGRFVPRSEAPPPVRIICTRGFSPVYNNEYLIHGLAALGPIATDVEVTFTSPGTGLEAARHLARQVLPPDVLARVAFLGGVSDDGMLENLQRSHIFVSLARSDGTATSLLEAMACGLFPVLADIPQNREWVDPSLENGILVPLDRPEALAAALRRAIADSALRNRAATTNRQIVLDRADSSRTSVTLASHLEMLAVSNRREC